MSHFKRFCPIDHYQVEVILLLLLMVFISSGFNQVQARSKQAHFKSETIKVDFDVTQPLIFADLNHDGQKEIIALGVDLDRKRQLVIFEKQNRWQVTRQLMLDESLIQVDIQRLTGEADRLLFLDNQGILRYHYDSNRLERALVTESMYVQQRAQYLATGNFSRDLNQDKQDDLIIPGIRKTRIFCWLPEKQTWQLSELNAPPWVDQQFDGANFRLLDFYAADMNGDGMADLVQAAGDVLHVYSATAPYQFAAEAFDYPLQHPIWAVEWWRLRDASGDTADQSHIDHRRLAALQDLNGDQIPDMMIRRELSSGVLERKLRYEFYFGRKQDKAVEFAAQADSFIEIEGTLERFRLLDLNGDGQFELISGSFEVGVSQVIGALLSGSIDEDLQVFALRDARHYQKEPVLEKEVSLNFSLSSGRSGVPVILTADLNGDKQQELILSRGSRKLSIYPGQSSAKPLGNRASQYRLKLPKEGDMLRASDLDGDGREELVVRYGKQDDPALLRQIRILYYQDSVN